MGLGNGFKNFTHHRHQQKTPSVSPVLLRHRPSLSPCHVMQDKSSGASGLKIEALSFLRAALTATPPATWQPHMVALAPGLWGCVAERQAKVREPCASMAVLDCRCSNCYAYL